MSTPILVPIDKPRNRPRPLTPFQFVKVPTNFFAWIPHISPGAAAVYLQVCRHTFGYKKREDAISQALLGKETGLSTRQVSRAVEELLAVELLRVSKKHRQLAVYEALPTRFLPDTSVT